MAGNPDANPPVLTVAASTTKTFIATFQINDAKLYIPVVTLSIHNNIKFLEQLKQGYGRTVSWNKYKLDIRTESKNNNLGCIIDQTFRNISRMFAL